MAYLKILIYALATFMATSTLVFADDDDDDDGEIPFAEAFLFFELNDTDGDLGIHGKIDGGPWKEMEIEDPKERTLLKVRAKGRLKRQGMTELFFESAEPTFDELSPAKFFKRFPEGEYEIEGESLEGGELENEVWLSHIMPAPPVVFLDGDPSAGIDICQCDEDELDENQECSDFWPTYAAPVTLKWDPVTMSHPELGTSGVDFTAIPPLVIIDDEGEEVEHGAIRFYEIVVEDGSEDTEFQSTAIVPPTTVSWEVPEAFLDILEEIKYEILVRTNVIGENGELVIGEIDGDEGPLPGNVTAIESCFKVEE